MILATIPWILLVNSLHGNPKTSLINKNVFQHYKSQTFRLFGTIQGRSPQVLSQRPLPTNATDLQMLSFYRFSQIENPTKIRDELFSAIQDIPSLRGTIYLAPEGVNAQLAVPCGESLDTLLKACMDSLPFDPFEVNAPNLGDVVPLSTPTFQRLIVRTRDAVLRDGLSEPLDWEDAGLELTPNEWDQHLRKPESEFSNEHRTVLDCRNWYESEQGSFEGASMLDTQVFQESWPVIEEKMKDVSKDQPIYIFCTGGIRCVKVGSYLKQKLGFMHVRRLQHGIIGYQKWQAENRIDKSRSKWKGENFLFDKRQTDSDDESKE